MLLEVTYHLFEKENDLLTVLHWKSGPIYCWHKSESYISFFQKSNSKAPDRKNYDGSE